MRCHYEVLEVPTDVNDEDLKKAYRRQALKWHPDKNPNNLEEAKEQFQSIQQAYEVLSNPHERAFYDKHKDVFLRQDYDESNSIDLTPYFTASCYKGYGDSVKGFFHVYRDVFIKIAVEEMEFSEEEISIPDFGKSTSSYYNTVHDFYAFWQSFSTKKTYSWLKAFDINMAPNRRVLRLIEKENKRIRDKAKKDYNDTVRNLVEFVRKKDKRVHNQALVAKQEKAENALKLKEKRRQQMIDRKKEMAACQQEEWSKFSNLEKELQDIEASVAKEFGDEDSSYDEKSDINSDNEQDVEELSHLFCIACNKLFKTEKAFQNHENSKKHKDNVNALREQMLAEESDLNSSVIDEDESVSEHSGDDDIDVSPLDSCDNSEDELSGAERSFNENKEYLEAMPQGDTDGLLEKEEVNEDLHDTTMSKKKTKARNSNIGLQSYHDDEFHNHVSKNLEDTEEEFVDISLISNNKKKKSKNKGKKIIEQSYTECDDDLGNLDSIGKSKKQRKKTENMKILQENLAQERCKSIKAETKEDSPNEASEEKVKPEVKEPTAVGDDENVDKNKIKIKKADKQENNLCLACKRNFVSKNKLFSHLKQTGHAVVKNIPTETPVVESKSNKKKKGKK